MNKQKILEKLEEIIRFFDARNHSHGIYELNNLIEQIKYERCICINCFYLISDDIEGICGMHKVVVDDYDTCEQFFKDEK